MTILDPAHTFGSLADSVGLDSRLTKALVRLGHCRPTLVQSKCLPLALGGGRDLLVRAQTGSGKTLAYLLPLLQKILKKTEASSSSSENSVGAVILAPTRELCAQVHGVLETLTYYGDVRVAVLSVGQARGAKSRQDRLRQETLLRDNPHILVATPNGLVSHLRNGAVSLSSAETVVIDEADLVLSFGYANDIAEIVKALPRIYQGFLMSATLSPEVDSLKSVVLNSPVTVEMERESKSDTGNLKQFYLALPSEDKSMVVYTLLKLGLLRGKGLFFVNSTDAGFRLKLFLEQFHIRSSVLNAELPFRSRLNIIEQFNLGNFDYLIATDESADADSVGSDDEDAEEGESKKKNKKDPHYGVSRGLDFRNVSFVMNVDFPPNAKSYTHRVGRTARGGAKGVALSLLNEKSEAEYRVLESIQEDQPPVTLPATLGESVPVRSNLDPAVSSNLTQHPQPTPLDFDLAQIEGFRYRVQDVARAVTKSAIRQARAQELKQEILNSDRLESLLNPSDLQFLQHDHMTTTKTHAHLKHVPNYLLPRGMQVANLNRKRRKKRTIKQRSKGTAKDPLQSFEASATLDGVEGEDDPMAEFLGDDDEEEGQPEVVKAREPSQIFTNGKLGAGMSNAGRNEWKRKHKKGKFSEKNKKRRRKEPLGI